MAAGKQRGFTLIELVAVITVLAVVSVSFVSMFSATTGARGLDVSLQTAAQVSQTCAEHIISLRRNDTGTGYAGIGGATHCGAAFTFNGFTPTDVTAAYAGAACPAGANCKQVTVTTTDGATSHTLNLLLTDY